MRLPPARAGCGRSAGSGSGRGGRGRSRRTRTARRSGGSAWRRRRAPSPARPASRPRRRSTEPRSRSRPRSAISGSSAFRTSAAPAARCAAPAPSCRRSPRARRSGRAGRGTGCRAGSRAGASSAATEASHSSSTSNSPSSPAMRPRARAASSSVVATPPAMFAPARLCTSGMPARSKIAGGHRGGGGLAVGGRDQHAAVRAGGRRGRRSRRARGASAPCPGRSSHRRRAAGERADGAREGELGARARPLIRLSSVGRAEPRRSRSAEDERREKASPVRRPGTSIVTAPVQRPDAHRQLADRIAVGVHRERAVGGDVHLAGAEHAHAGQLDVRAA